ncbi:hypothetical protein EAX61_10635 [Dokdonia sinensis]|uniref:Uncharacterized protein n=1 Tax=Dokdonia sinensis TaxID=2479847 RepID=A0A3M0FXV7_9FLAO|nr:hypothetical protein [Dokdonia sinensis]RMB57570.1 hypothetical protein EAX61_10635 [Dokdonia sinensis]
MESVKRIEVLLERYFEGETTLVEEKTLRDYFTGEDVAPHLEVYCGMFSAFAKAQQETLPTTIKIPSKKRNWSWIASVAATVIIAIGLFSQLNQNAGYEGTYENEEVAVLKAKQAFGVMSKMFNQSTAQLEVVSEFQNAPAPFITN